ncbi:hypothetical protein AB0I10_39280 [Streptomyces sp. NPDC050636]|uniref:hypothetical protein n=1 Tax=Streptomyces sp. NPDC050636 TaxID=3154510 RepID=UPI00343A68E9
MIIAFLAFMALGLVAAVAPGAILGYAFVAMSGRLSRRVRVPLLLALATGSAAMWLVVVEASNIWRPVIVMLSFTATLVSGITSLVLEARRRRAPQFPTAVWPG